MFEIELFSIAIILCLIINFVCLRFSILIDRKFFSHKSYITKNITPLSGGIIFYLLSFSFINYQNYLIYYLSFGVFFVGILSDMNYLNSPIKRLFLQIFLVFMIINLSQIFIETVRIPFFDSFLENIYFKYFFSIFCFLILINGTNFIDGVNTLLLGYFLLVVMFSYLIVSKLNIEISLFNPKLLIIILFSLLIFNTFGKLFTGDSGAYFISFIIGYYLIILSNKSEIISPYFIACLLWYPAYECLFSIIRKKLNKSFAFKPDNKHLHHLIFLYLKKNYKLSNNTINSLSGLLINLFNLLTFTIAYNNYFFTKNLLILLLINIICYNLSYFFLNKKNV